MRVAYIKTGRETPAGQAAADRAGADMGAQGGWQGGQGEVVQIRISVPIVAQIRSFRRVITWRLSTPSFCWELGPAAHWLPVQVHPDQYVVVAQSRGPKA